MPLKLIIMKRTTSLIFTVIILFQFCKAQMKSPPSLICKSELSTFIKDRIQYLYSTEYYDQLHFNCTADDFSVQWKIDSLGNIIDFTCNKKNIPEQLQECIKRALLSTNGKWISAYQNEKQILSRPFTLSISYSFYAACKNENPRKHITDSVYASAGRPFVPLEKKINTRLISAGHFLLIDKR